MKVFRSLVPLVCLPLVNVVLGAAGCGDSFSANHSSPVGAVRAAAAVYFNYPTAVAVDSSGEVYVADTRNNRIEKFNAGGTLIDMWGASGTGVRQFDNPRAIAVDPAGFVYVADTLNNRIQKFTLDGVFQKAFGSAGTAAGQFASPQGIAVDGLGNIYVADTLNHRIQKFARAGGFRKQWGGLGTGVGQFNEPRGIAVNSVGNVYVSDAKNNRIQKFKQGGAFVKAWGAEGTGDGQFNGPRNVAVDPAGYVYVTDAWNHRVQKFAANGTFVTKWGVEGTGDGQFSGPNGVAVDGSYKVYVADSGNHRIEKFGRAGAYLAQWGIFAEASPMHFVRRIGIAGGTGPGHLYGAEGLALDTSGNVYVTENLSGEVSKFTTDGTFVQVLASYQTRPIAVAIAPDGTVSVVVVHPASTWEDASGTVVQMTETGTYLRNISDPDTSDTKWYPTGIAADPVLGNLYVLSNGLVYKFTPAGEPLTHWDCPGTAITVASNGVVYVADGSDVISKFNRAGTFLGQWSITTGQSKYPKDLAVDSKGIIWVTCRYTNQVERWSPNGVFMESFGSYGSGDVQFKPRPEGIDISPEGEIYVAAWGSAVQVFAR